MNWTARKDIHLTWKKYDRGIRSGFRRSEFTKRFDNEMMARGVLPLSEDVSFIVCNAKPMQFAAASTSPGFHTSSFDDERAKVINASSHFRVIADDLKWLMETCVGHLCSPVAEALGTPWRIHNVRVWTTPPNADATGMYNFHRDGFPWAIFKVMIYFTPMDGEHGTLEINPGDGGDPMMLIGPAGSWLLFHNSTLVHRGLPGTKYERACAEITLSRAARYDLNLHQPGLNAHFPVEP